MDSIEGNLIKKVVTIILPWSVNLLIMAHCFRKNIILMMNIVVNRCIKYIGLTGNSTKQAGTQSM